MGRRQAPRRKHQGGKATKRKFVNHPSLKWMENGQVLFANVTWSDDFGEGEKRRPVVFIEQIDHEKALVRPMYTRQTQDHQRPITYNRSRRYIGPPIEIDRNDITTVTNERIEWA